MRTLIAFFALLVPIGCCLAPVGLAPEASDPAPSDPAPAPAVAEPPPPVASRPPPLAAPPRALPAPARPRISAFDALESGAPQARDVRALYESSRAAHEGTIDHGMLVCRARLNGGGYDDGFFAGGADVALAARFGDTAIRSTQQSGLRTYSFPILRLERGDDVWIRVVDRDVFVDDPIAEGAIRYERAPFSLRMGQADVECRAVDPSIVARRSREAIAALGSAIDRLDGVAPDVSAYDLGYPSDRMGRVVSAAEDVLAWTHSSDDAYRREIDRATAFDGEWQRLASAAVSDAVDRLPPAGTSVRFGAGRRVSARETVCGPDALALAQAMGDSSIDAGSGGCLVVVAMEVDARTSLPPLARADAQWEAWALDGSANMLAARTIARRRDGAFLPIDRAVELEPGATIDLVMSLPAGSDPVLLRVRDGGRPVVLRLP